MSIKLTRRAAAVILKRGESSIRIKPEAHADAEKALTKDDVRELIKRGSVYALPMKKNMSVHGAALSVKRSRGRSRGVGTKKGTKGARQGVDYKTKIRAQRRIIKALKSDNTIDNAMFKKLYALVKGGTFANKITLIHRISSEGVKLSEERIEQLRHI
jgi:large subunit ribosomal protein L19e